MSWVDSDQHRRLTLVDEVEAVSLFALSNDVIQRQKEDGFEFADEEAMLDAAAFLKEDDFLDQRRVEVIEDLLPQRVV